jgi:hypothetical protein
VAHKRRRLERRGRPRQVDAKRRRTTAAGRAVDRDLGSPELIVRKARAGNGSAAPVELVDVAGILLAHHLIEPDEWGALRLLASWLGQFRRGFGLREASVNGLWSALTSGVRGGAVQPTGAGGDRALFRLVELHAYFRERGRPERRLLLALQVAAGEASPADEAELVELKSALRAVLALYRSGRGPRRRPPGLRGVVMNRPGSG